MEIMDVKAAAQYLRVKPVTIYRAVQRKEIPHVRLGICIRIAKSSLEEWIQKGGKE